MTRHDNSHGSTISALLLTALLVLSLPAMFFIPAGPVFGQSDSGSGATFSEDFGQYNVGDGLDDIDWSITKGTSSAVNIVGRPSLSEGKALKLDGSGGSNNEITADNFNPDQPTLKDVQVSMRRDPSSEGGNVQLHLFEGNDILIDVQLKNGNIGYYSGSHQSVDTDVQQGEWVNIWVTDIDTENNEYTVQYSSPSTSGSFVAPTRNDISEGYDSVRLSTNPTGTTIGYFDNVIFDDTTVISGHIVDVSGNPIESANVTAGDTTVFADGSGQYNLFLGPDYNEQELEVTASTAVDEETKLREAPVDDLNFTLADGDIGGQVLACPADDLQCQNPSPLPNATVEIVGLDHVEIENYFDNVSSPEEARQKAENLLEDARSWDIEGFDSDLSIVNDVVDTNPDATYPLIHKPEEWGIQGDTSLRDKIIAGETPELENPLVTVPPDEEVILSLWDPTQESTGILDRFFEDAASTDALGQPVSGKIEITKLGPGGEDMGTTGLPINTNIQSVEVSERVGIISGTEDMPVRSFTFAEGYYRIGVEGSPATYIVQAGNPDVQDIYPGYFQDIKDKQGQLLEKAQKLENLQSQGVFNTTVVQADENGRWSVDLPSSTKTVGVTAWKGPKDLLNVTDIRSANASVQAYIQNLRSEAITQIEAELESTLDELVAQGHDIENPENITQFEDIIESANVSLADVKSQMDESQFENSLLDEKIYAPRKPVEVQVPGNTDVKTTRVAAGSFLDPGLFDEIVDTQFDQFLDDSLQDLFSELDVPLEEIDNLEDLDSYFQSLMEDRQNMTEQSEALQTLISQLENADGDLSQAELEQLINDAGLNMEPGEAQQLAEVIQKYDELFPEDTESESNEALLERLAALETAITGLQETVSSGEDTVDISDGTLTGEFHFPGEIDEEATTVWIDWADSSAARQIMDDDQIVTSEPLQGSSTLSPEYWSVESSGLFGSGETVVIEDVPIPDDMAVADIRVDAVVNGTPQQNRGSIQNPAFAGEIPELNAIDVSTLRPTDGQTVRIDAVADQSRYDRLVDVTAYGPNGNPTDAEVDRLEDSAFVTMNGTGVHWIELTYQSTSGHNFTHDFQLQTVESGGAPGATIAFDQGTGGTIGMAGEGVRSVTVQQQEAQNEATIQVVAANSDIRDLHIRTLDTIEATDINIEVVSGEDRVTVDRHVTVYLHESINEDGLIWRNGEALPKDGSALGQYVEEDGIILTRTNANGETSVEVDQDPGLITRAQHWLDLRLQSLPGLAALSGLGVGLLIPIVVRLRRRVLP